MASERLEGGPDDPQPLADIANGDKELEAEAEDTGKDARAEPAAEVEAKKQEMMVPPNHNQQRKTREDSLANERLVRSVLCARIAIPPAESVSNRVLRAVLRGDAESLAETIKRKRLKGVAAALTADGRNRTALHLAVGTKSVTLVRALLQWRRELNHSLQDELHFLDQRRDMFVERALAFNPHDWSSKGNAPTRHQIDHFETWLSEERRRLVRITELRCEECWRKVLTTRDDKGRTPLHWAASASGSDENLLEALLVTGRADLSARDVSNRSDMSIFAALKATLGSALCDRNQTKTSEDHSKTTTQRTRGNEAAGHLIFPVDGLFHRRTGKIRHRRRRRGGVTHRAEGQGEKKHYRHTQQAQGSGSRQGPDGLTAGAAKVKWFCEALGKTAEKYSGSRRGGAEAFLLSVFEDFDRSGDGTLSMRRFRDALDDVNVRVSEQTLLEVGRYFQAPTLKHRRDQLVSDDSRCGNIRGNTGSAIDLAPFEMSYVPLMDIVFGRKVVRESTRGVGRDSENATDESMRDHEAKPDHVRRLDKRHPKSCICEDCDVQVGDDEDDDEDDEDDDDNYVDVNQVRTARVAVIEGTDDLGRSPLFLAAAVGSVPAAKALLRHGASTALAVNGTGLTPYSVAPNLAMKRVLAAEARQSLNQAISDRASGKHLFHGEAENEGRHGRYDREEGHPVAMSNDANKQDETRRMEMWVSTLAEGELAPITSSETRVDQKTSLHLAATAGLPEAVKDLLGRGVGEPAAGGTYAKVANGMSGTYTAKAVWKTSWKVTGDARLNTAHIALDHQSLSPELSTTAGLTTDANGWSALHACCAGTSPRHYSCALALLRSERDVNARTNTGKTPLHVAASAAGLAKFRTEGDLIPLLVSHGADLEARDGDGLRPIHCAAKSGRHFALLALLAAGADLWSVTPRQWNALHYSVAGGYLDTIRLLSYWDSDTGALSGQKNMAGVTATGLRRAKEISYATPTIWEAAALGEVEHVSRACLESARTPKDTTGKPWACPGVSAKTPGLGFTPLHACIAGLAAVTRGLDVSPPCFPPRPRAQANAAPQPSLYTRLARGYGRLATGRRGGKGDRNLQKEGVAAYPLCIGKYVGVCRTLISAGADVEALDARCRTPLALAAAAGSIEVVETLLKAGANPRACDVDRNTPLHFSFAYANAAVGALLAHEGADLNACNRSGMTPQDVAGLRADLAPDDIISA